MGNLSQGLTTLIIKNFFLISHLNLPSFSLRLPPLSYDYMPLLKVPRIPKFLLSVSSAPIPKFQALEMTQKRSKEPVDLSDVLCLTQPLTSVENVHDVFKGAVVKTGSSRSAVDGKKNL